MNMEIQTLCIIYVTILLSTILRYLVKNNLNKFNFNIENLTTEITNESKTKKARAGI